MRAFFGGLATVTLLWASGAVGQDTGEWAALLTADSEVHDLLASNRPDDAKKALMLLRAESVERLLDADVSLGEPAQAETLEHFGRAALIARDDFDQGLRAARRLQALRPDYPFAYRLELELIAATSRSAWTNERRSDAKRAYERYVESRKGKPSIRSPLSDPAEELAFPDYPSDACGFLAKMEGRGRRAELDQYLNPEPASEDVSVEKLRLLVEGSAKFDLGAAYSVSRVDVDGDEVSDLLVKAVGGAASCNYWWAYKQTRGKALAGPLLFSFGEASYCGTLMSFFRHRGKNFVYEDAGQGIGGVMNPAKVIKGSDAPMTALCKLDYQYRYDRAKVEASCSERACGEIAKIAPQIASAPSAMRAGKEVQGDFGTYLDNAYEIDMGNDGSKVVFGTSYKGPWNPQLTLLRQSESGKYEQFTPSEQWGDYGQIDDLAFDKPVLGHTFVRVAGKNYWVVTTQGANGARNLNIFVIEGRKVWAVGFVAAVDVPVTVQVRRE